VHADRGLAQAQRLADLGRALPTDLAQRKYGALPLRQLRNGHGDLSTALGRQQSIFRVRLGLDRLARRDLG
jgi:hypothetical protein